MTTILVVDDQPSNRKLLTALLGRAGYRMLEAGDGAAALEVIRREHPDLVITDLLMPVMDGYELVRQLRADPAIAHIPTIFYTAQYYEHEARALAEAAGILEVLVKPIDSAMVLRTVASVVNRINAAPAAPLPDAFDREHLRLITNKLAQKAEELESVNARLTLLLELGRQLALEPDPLRLLQVYCDRGRDLIGAQYATIGLLDDDGQMLEQLFTSGIEPEMAAHMATQLPCRDMLGALLADGRALRIEDAGVGQEGLGLLPNSPAIRAFLGAPIATLTRVYGWVCLGNKPGGGRFSAGDEQIVLTLAAQIAVGYENARRYGDIQRHAEALEKEIAERHHVEEVLRQRADELAALNATLLDITARRHVPTLLHTIVVRAVQLLSASGGILSLCDAEQCEARVVISFRTRRNYTGTILRYGEGVIGTVAQTGEPLLIDDYQIWSGRVDVFQEDHPISEVLGVPMRWEDRVIGVLTLIHYTEGQRFSQADLELLTMFANHAAIAVESARLLEAEQAARRNAEILRAANLALTQSLDLETVLGMLLAHLGRLVPYDSANVMLLEGGTRLVVSATYGYERWNDPKLIDRISFDVHTNPIFRQLLLTHESILVPDSAAQPVWEYPPGTEHVRSWLCVPIVAGGALIGVYSMDKAEPGFFTREHQRLAEALAAQAAVAIQNARLIEQVRSSRAQLQALSRQLVETQEAERRHIARELHDEIGQVLTGLKLVMEMVGRVPADQTRGRITQAQEFVNELVARVRELSLDLRPAMLDDLGLLPALLWHFERYTMRTRVQVNFRHNILERRFPPEVETAAYRIVQEALTNVARYAEVSEVMVRLWVTEETLLVHVEDHGQGFDVDAALKAHASNGLSGMRERAALLGGQLIIESAVRTGTRLNAELPLDGVIPFEVRSEVDGDDHSGR